MALNCKYFPLDGGAPVTAQGYSALIQRLAKDEDDEDNFDTVELYHPDGDGVEAVTYCGEVIGTLNFEPDNPISEYETYDQMELREAAEEAARDLNYEARLDARRAG